VIDVTSPIIQVVTSGIDWPATAAAISGGVVGLAGIAFGARQASRASSAEDARAKVAEKRRIYASCLATLTVCGAAEAALQRDDLSEAERARLEEERDRAQVTAVNAESEVALIGPAEVSELANRATRVLITADFSSQTRDVVRAITKVKMAMRRDLGEDAPPLELGALGPSSHSPDYFRGAESARTSDAGDRTWSP
jgi:uncharacterized membrane protein YidH (DUF202 family)